MKLTTLAMLLRVTVEFFWGEATWGITDGLRHLRWLRLTVCILPFVSGGLVCWAIIGAAAAESRDRDSYSYYEGKVLEERLTETRYKLSAQGEDIKKLLEQSNTSTLLAVRMQSQIERMQELLDAGIKVLGGVVVAVVANLLKDILAIRLRRERRKLRQSE